MKRSAAKHVYESGKLPTDQPELHGTMATADFSSFPRWRSRAKIRLDLRKIGANELKFKVADSTVSHPPRALVKLGRFVENHTRRLLTP